MNDSVDFAILAHKFEALQGDLSDVKTALRDVASALSKLALIEERQSLSTAALQRAFGVLEKLEGRVTALETTQPVSRLVIRWVLIAVSGCTALALLFVAKQAGLG